jgi:glycosyl transferase family 25
MLNEELKNNIWIINLDKSKDRMEKIKKNFEKYGIKYNRFSAVYGKNLSDEYMEKNVNFLCKKLLCNYAMIGCASSHKYLWKQLINSNEDFYIIFEDDIEINDKSFEIIKKIIPFFDNKELDIDYVNLNCVNTGCSIYKTEFKIDNYEFGKPYFPLGTNSYIITKKGAQKLLKKILLTTYHVDFEILFVKFFTNFNYYTSNLQITNLTHDKSTIASKNDCSTLKLLDFFNLKSISWTINEPLLTINLFFEINLLIILLLLLFVINNYYINSQIIFWFVILELFLITYSLISNLYYMDIHNDKI